MTRLTILIPFQRAAQQFETTLASVLQNRPADCEVLVLHSQPYDDPYDVGHEVRFLQISGQPTLAQLINAGIEAAHGEYIHLLASGLEVEEAWTDSPLEHFYDREVASVTPLILGNKTGSQVQAAGVGYGSLTGQRLLVGGGKTTGECRGLASRIIGPTLAAGFYRQETLAAIGGFNETVGDDLADIDLALSLQALGYCSTLDATSKLYATGEVAVESSINHRNFASGRQTERLFWRHQAHTGGWTGLLLHPLAVCAELVGQLASLAGIGRTLGRLAATFEMGTARHAAAELQSALRALDEQAKSETISLEAARQQRQQAIAAKRKVA